MLVGAGLLEGSEAGGEWGFAGVLGDDQCAGGKELAATGAAEKVERGLVLDFELVGWVEVENVDGAGWAFDRLAETAEQGAGAAVFKGVAAGDLECGKVGA